MSIKKNPYDVGYTEGKKTSIFGQCRCCQDKVVAHGVPGVDPVPDLCVDCAEHSPEPEEPVDRELLRLRTHYARKLRVELDLREQTHRLALEVSEQAEKVRSALRSRDRYREALEAIERVHRPGTDRKCGCGRPSPCSTVRAVLDVDRHVWAEVGRRASRDDYQAWQNEQWRAEYGIEDRF